MKVGLYGGTFDPIHRGHLNLALRVLEEKGLDEVWFVPTGVNPFKLGNDVTPGEHRLAMTRLAAQGYPQLKVLDVEIRRPGVSFAIDTLRELLPQFPDTEFCIIVGEDAALGLPRWKEIDEVRSLVPIWVGKRRCGPAPKVEGWVELPVFEISSTEVRERLRQGLECRHLVPGKVLDYIHSHQVY